MHVGHVRGADQRLAVSAQAVRLDAQLTVARHQSRTRVPSHQSQQFLDRGRSVPLAALADEVQAGLIELAGLAVDLRGKRSGICESNVLTNSGIIFLKRVLMRLSRPDC